MSVPTVYRSDDPSAPTLNGLVGSLVAVLRACLITGYGSKAAAGWTVAAEDAPNHTIIFRNHSNRLFRLQDNGIVNRDTSSVFFTTPRGSQAALIGMETYIDINTPVQPYPRVIVGGDLHHLTANGVTIRKRRTPDSQVAPWIVVANNRACHIFTTIANINTNALPFPYNTFRGVTSFGDIRSLNPGNAGLPVSYVKGGMLGAVDVLAHGVDAGTLDIGFVTLSHIRHIQGSNLFLNRSLETASSGVEGVTKGMYWPLITGGRCLPTVNLGEFMTHPSVGNFGAELQPLLINENLNDEIRTHRTTLQYTAEVGVIPGLYGCMHTTSPATSQRIGNELSTITQDGVNYMLISQSRYAASSTEHSSDLLAVQLSDWYL